MNNAINSHRTNYNRTGHNYLNVTVPIIFLLVILFFSAWVRFDGITEQGIFQGDNCGYTREAKRWATGQPPRFMGKFYRPVSYFLQGMAIRIFGYNDYSIKIMHGIMDMISIILIFLIASILTRDLWAGVLSSLLYAFLPGVVRLVRAEWVQVESTFFVLLALFFFILFDSRQNRNSVKFFLLFISGFCSGLAANTHPELAFLAPGYVLYLFIKSYNSQNKKESLKEFLILASIFTFSFFTPYLLGFLFLGIKKVLRVFFNEISIVKFRQISKYGQTSKPILFFYILYYSIKHYFGKHFFLICMLPIGTIIIIIYRKMKKVSDSLLAYFPLFLIFSYTFLYSCILYYFPTHNPRIFLPLLPLVIFIITLWYYKIFKQLFGKYSLIVFICFFSILFLLNPKVIPGKTKYRYISRYRLIYDILKNDVNSKNKLLIAPVTTYAFDKGFKLDLYFGKNAVYIAHITIKDEYNLKSLKELLRDKNIRYVFLAKKIIHWLINRVKANADYPLPKYYQCWLRNEKFHYSLEKDLEIIQAYIKDRGGLVIDKNRFGKIYYLTDVKPVQKEPGLITNASFEHWWKGFPMREWKLISGKVSRSAEATKGSFSIRFEPTAVNDKKGTRMVWVFGKPLHLLEQGSKLRVRLDARSEEPGKLVFFFSAKINGKGKIVEPGIVRYTGKGEWVTLSGDFAITPDMEWLFFNLWLRAGAKEPAFVDNLSIIVKD